MTYILLLWKLGSSPGPDSQCVGRSVLVHGVAVFIECHDADGGTALQWSDATGAEHTGAWTRTRGIPSCVELGGGAIDDSFDWVEVHFPRSASVHPQTLARLWRHHLRGAAERIQDIQARHRLHADNCIELVRASLRIIEAGEQRSRDERARFETMLREGG